MKYAFPADELNPLTCSPRTRDPNPHNWPINDVLGNFSLTLVDSLDAFAIMNDPAGFEKAVKLVIQTVRFDKSSRVQVFETNIRILGSLLSAHILASNVKYGYALDWYNDELLFLAQDLGIRLLAAFKSPSGIPYPR
jgi:mannosidase alpha-like ER degradation enhancer 1